MEEYMISTNSSDAPSDWMEQVSSTLGVAKITNNNKCLLVKCSIEVSKKLKDKFN